MMAPILYMNQFSGPVRSVLLTAAALDLKLNHKIIDLAKKEHLTPEFKKINPQHTIPTLDDNGVIIWDSHAINTYLVDKYGKDDSLYPKDLVKRAHVDQKLYFDASPVFSWLRLISRAVKYRGLTFLTDEQKEGLDDTYEHLNNFLDGKRWICGDFITVADFSLIANVTSLNLIYLVDSEMYPNVISWLRRAEDLPYYRVGPQHVVVPTLGDNGYVIWDSHAIIAYLVGKYGKDDSLYPRDVHVRAAIVQRLLFDSGVISFFAKTISAELVECSDDTYQIVEDCFTYGNKWIASDALTIADLSLLHSITSLDAVVPIDQERFPRVKTG